MQAAADTWVINTGQQRYTVPGGWLTARLPDGRSAVMHTCLLARYRNGDRAAGPTITVVRQ